MLGDISNVVPGTVIALYCGGQVVSRLIVPPGDYAYVTSAVLNKDGIEERVYGKVNFYDDRLTGIQKEVLARGENFDLMAFYADYRDELLEDPVLSNICSERYLRREAFESFVLESRSHLESFETGFRDRFGAYLDKLNDAAIVNETENLPHYKKEILRQKAMISDARDHIGEVLSRLDLKGKDGGLSYGTSEVMGGTDAFLNRTFEGVILTSHASKKGMMDRFYSLTDLRQVLSDEVGKLEELGKDTVVDYVDNLEKLIESGSSAWNNMMESLPWEEEPTLSGIILTLIVLIPLVGGSALLVIVIKRLMLLVGKGLSGIVAQVIEDKETVKFTFVSRLLKASGILVTFFASLIFSDQYGILPDGLSSTLRRLEAIGIGNYLGIDDTCRNGAGYFLGLDNVFMMVGVSLYLLVGLMIYFSIIARRVIRERRESKNSEVIAALQDPSNLMIVSGEDCMEDEVEGTDILTSVKEGIDSNVSVDGNVQGRLESSLDNKESS